jgi:tRNA (mo5U34)-methyltransferase
MPSSAEIEARIKELAPWHFSIEVLPGVTTTDFNPDGYRQDTGRVGTMDPEEMRPLLQHALPGGLSGKSFLDVRCNGGGYCFIAHELGARLCYGFDVREHWIRQATFVKSVKYGSAETIIFSTADVQKVEIDQQFDLTLFKGVLYHLPDPLHMLIKLCGLTSRVIIIDTVSRNDIPENCIVPNNESLTGLMSGVNGLCWYPGGPEALQPLLAWCGFPFVRTVSRSVGAKTGVRRGRFRMIAARDEAALSAFDPWQRREKTQAAQ